MCTRCDKFLLLSTNAKAPETIGFPRLFDSFSSKLSAC